MRCVHDSLKLSQSRYFLKKSKLAGNVKDLRGKNRETFFVLYWSAIFNDFFNDFRKRWSLFFFCFCFRCLIYQPGVQKRSNYYSTSSQFLFSFDDNDSKVVSLKAWLVSNHHEYQWFGIIFCMDMKTFKRAISNYVFIQFQGKKINYCSTSLDSIIFQK